MKKVNLLLAAVVAASMSAPAFADFQEIETHGYFRATANQGKGGKMTKWNVNKVGRLGNEADTYGEFSAKAAFAKVNDTVWSFTGQWVLFSTESASPWDNNIGNTEAFLSVDGFFENDKDATIWAGKRYRRDYVGITDWYYGNYSGYGVGIDNLSVGNGKFTTYWTRQDGSCDYLNAADSNNKVTGKRYADYITVDYRFPVWDGGELELNDTYGVVSRQSGDYHAVNDLSNNNRFKVELHQVLSSGWNGTVVEWFHGSNAGVLSCGGYDVRAESNNANTYRVFNQGNYKFNETYGIEHAVVYAYTGYDEDYSKVDTDKYFSAVVRPQMKLTPMTKLLAEFGAYKQVTKKFDGEKVTENGQKYTLAYAITTDASSLWGPSIRFFVSYIHADNHSSKTGRSYVSGITAFDDAYKGKLVNHNVMFGVQAEGSW